MVNSLFDLNPYLSKEQDYEPWEVLRGLISWELRNATRENFVQAVVNDPVCLLELRIHGTTAPVEDIDYDDMRMIGDDQPWYEFDNDFRIMWTMAPV